MRERIATAIAALVAASLAVSSAAVAAESNDAALGSIVVTATRIAESSSDIPASIDRVEADALQRGQLQVNLS
jgi:outer membrane receptor protein involved in Fe transport